MKWGLLGFTLAALLALACEVRLLYTYSIPTLYLLYTYSIPHYTYSIPHYT